MPKKQEKELSPSPYLQNFVKSSFKQTNGGGGSLNDSLDKLKMEFMHGYNEVMQESDAAQKLETFKQTLSVGKRRSDALTQMLAAAAPSQSEHQMELRFIKEENEVLKKVIEQMKLDMETIVDNVKEKLAAQ